ncbi:hypothetical protein Ahy_B04g069178 isoform B [Arachis hypogaea]|uniref:Protein FAR1-RELATED SEQUENCE n=1 Tax=Arachis hypogaea TaxID=3818 RepID=A0A444ZBV0_ARAHY|nr:hypothetical protein Ahy_B04g069178 isoform B [Arachis hypogaea]
MAHANMGEMYEKIPDGILTDQCETLLTTIQNVMPNTRPRLYLWHIMKKIQQKFEGFSRFKEINATIGRIVWSLVDKNYLRVHGITSLKSTTFIITNGSTKELECDAVDKGLIPCVSYSPIEKQFQYEYTNCIFRDVQTEFIKKSNHNLSPRVMKDNQYFYEVTEQKIVIGIFNYNDYEVVRYNCFMFELYGILCCQTLPVLSHCRFNKSKNIYRKHTHIRSNHDSRCSDKSMNIFRGLCVDF